MTVTVGGTITGLAGTGLVLTDSVSGGTATPAASATSFTISPAINSGASYNISVTTQPSGPTQNCVVTSGGTGTANATVTSVVITCTTTTFTVGGTISGTLTGTGLVVKDTVSGSTKTVLPGATTFTITPAVNSGASYNIIVTGQPASPTESCSVTSGASGTVGAANVTSVVVTCAISTFTVGGTITGYTGSGMVLTDSVSGHTKTVPASASSFTITPAVNSGATYNVTVTTQPTVPAQFCTVTGGTGTVTTANITSVGVTCRTTGKFVFVSNTVDNPGGSAPNGSLSAFTVNAATGALTPVTGSNPLSVTGTKPFGIAVDPSGLFIYVADIATANVASYAVNPGTGGLTPGTTATAGTDTVGTTQPHSVTLSPSGAIAYVGSFDTPNGNITSYTVLNGVLTRVVASPAPPYSSPSSLGVVVDPSNLYVIATNTFVGKLSMFTVGAGGTLTPILGSPFPFQSNNSAVNDAYAIAMYPTGGFVYITDWVANTVTAYSYDSTGLTELAAPITVGTKPESVAVDPSGRFLYVATNGNNGSEVSKVTAFTIDPTTGILNPTAIGTVLTGGGISGSTVALQVDPSGQFVYTANGDGATASAFSIDQASGALTPIGSPLTTGSGSQGVAVE